MSDRTGLTRPVTRYFGGKWRIAPWIIGHFPPHRTYVEPFGGVDSVLVRKPRSYAEVYNDLDGEIVNLFRVLRDHSDDLVRVVSLTPFARDEFDAAYHPSDDPVEQARRTLVRGGMGFGSTGVTKMTKTGFRCDTARHGTVPAHDWGRTPANLAAVAERLQGVIIENRPAMYVMDSHDSPSTLHFVDPPYVWGTRTANRDYKHELTDSEHRELAGFLSTLKGMVCVSGYRSALYDEIYAGWEVHAKSTQDQHRNMKTEHLWMNRAAASQARQLSLILR